MYSTRPHEKAKRPVTIREEIQEREKAFLCKDACLSSATRGRRRITEPCSIRTPYQRDRDRIVYCKAFRRLKHKTQVFLSPMGDHYRTRLTHTLEVAEIARTISRALRLNEDLTEAVAMGHDLGHTPFGHAGETILNEIVPGGFSHCRQSLRVVDLLENAGRGLNLTWEVRDGILKHSKGFGDIIPKTPGQCASTLEGKVVRIADVIAYLSHDLDDAIRSKVINQHDVPRECTDVLGNTHGSRISNMIKDIISQSVAEKNSTGINLDISPLMLDTMMKLRKFLYDNVYRAPQVHKEFEKARKILYDLYMYFIKDADAFATEKAMLFEEKIKLQEKNTPYERMVCDFIAGMTDRYALNLYTKIFMPSSLV